MSRHSHTLSERCASRTVGQRFAAEVVAAAGILDERTAELLEGAFGEVSRAAFLPKQLEKRSFEDIELPTSFGQFTPRASVVARMLGLVGVGRGMRLLEIGTGCGYTAALMAAAGAEVFTVEIVGLLAQQTRKLLDSIGYQNIIVRRGNGVRGWAEHAPYDAIIVSTVVPRIEQSLLEQSLLAQLKLEGGRLIAPVLLDDPSGSPALVMWERKPTGFASYRLESVPFSMS